MFEHIRKVLDDEEAAREENYKRCGIKFGLNSFVDKLALALISDVGVELAKKLYTLANAPDDYRIAITKYIRGLE